LWTKPGLNSLLAGGLTVDDKQHLEWIKSYFKEICQDPNYDNFLGIEMIDLKEGTVSFKLAVSDRHCNIYGTVHGGILASISDITMGATCLTLGKSIVTIDLNISYIRNSQKGSILTSVGQLIGSGNSIIRTEGKVFDERQRLLVVSRASYFITGSFLKNDHP
jgi:acyl-CoA thioesterase